MASYTQNERNMKIQVYAGWLFGHPGQIEKAQLTWQKRLSTFIVIGSDIIPRSRYGMTESLFCMNDDNLTTKNSLSNSSYNKSKQANEKHH